MDADTIRGRGRDELLVALLDDYGRSLHELHRAGLVLVHHPEAPSWFCAQRVLVAAARGRLAQVDPDRRESARKQEAKTLLRLRDEANRTAKTRKATTRTLKRQRRRLEALAFEWEEQANLLVYGTSS